MCARFGLLRRAHCLVAAPPTAPSLTHTSFEPVTAGCAATRRATSLYLCPSPATMVPAGTHRRTNGGRDMKYFALVYYVVDDFVTRRTPYREEHLRLVREAHRRGELVMAGPLNDPIDRALLVFRA